MKTRKNVTSKTGHILLATLFYHEYTEMELPNLVYFFYVYV